MKFRIVFIGLALVLGGCHDSDPAASGAATQPPPSSAPSAGTAKFVISFPIANAAPSAISRIKSMLSGRRPVIHSYVSPKTQSLSVTLASVNGATPPTPAGTIVNVVAGSDCVAGSGVLNCTVSIDAPVGNDGFEVRTFAQANGVGGAISIGDTTANITAGATADASVDLLPVVSSISVNLSPTSLPIGSAGTFTATITAKDVTGDVIGGTDNYYQPLTITTADAGAHVTASPALPVTFSSPSQNTITFTYDGAGNAASYSFVIGGGASQTVSFVFSSNTEHLYVVGQFSPAAVFVFDIQPDGSITGPSRTITGTNTTLNRPTSIAVDTLGQVYVANYGTYPLQGDNVAVFAPGADGNVAPIQTLLQGSQPYYVAKGAIAFLLRSTTADASATSVLLNGGSPYIDPDANAFSSYIQPNGSGFLCVTNSIPEDGGAGYVACITSPLEFVSGNIDPGTANIINGQALNNYEFGGGSPSALAFQEDGNLLVAYGPSYNQNSSIKTFVMPGDPASALQTQPIRSITGSNTGLTFPTDVAYDSQGNIYVSDTGGGSGSGAVFIYAPNSDGNVAPIHSITGLNYPFGIAIGK